MSSEEELQRLVSHALQHNPYSQRLKDALIKQTWDGTVIFCLFVVIYILILSQDRETNNGVKINIRKIRETFNATVLSALFCIYRFCLLGESFAGSVDKRRLAIDIKDIVKKM